jgi:hypothetical protein
MGSISYTLVNAFYLSLVSPPKFGLDWSPWHAYNSLGKYIFSSSSDTQKTLSIKVELEKAMNLIILTFLREFGSSIT